MFSKLFGSYDTVVLASVLALFGAGIMYIIKEICGAINRCRKNKFHIKILYQQVVLIEKQLELFRRTYSKDVGESNKELRIKLLEHHKLPSEVIINDFNKYLFEMFSSNKNVFQLKYICDLQLVYYQYVEGLNAMKKFIETKDEKLLEKTFSYIFYSLYNLIRYFKQYLKMSNRKTNTKNLYDRLKIIFDDDQEHNNAKFTNNVQISWEDFLKVN